MSKHPITDGEVFRINGEKDRVVPAHIAERLEEDRAELVEAMGGIADRIEEAMSEGTQLPGYATVRMVRALLKRMEDK